MYAYASPAVVSAKIDLVAKTQARYSAQPCYLCWENITRGLDFGTAVTAAFSVVIRYFPGRRSEFGGGCLKVVT
jgi:hypothetical protein